MNDEVNPYFSKANEYPEYLINETEAGLNQKQQDQLIHSLNLKPFVHLEIGSGSGQFLIESAEKNPDKLFIGVEIRYKRAVRTVEKALKKGITNFLICRCYAETIMALLPESSLECIYINFPDPWDKKRWFKHRIISTDNLKIFSRLLIPSGRFSFKTDHAGYFQWSNEIFSASQDFKIDKSSLDLHKSEYASENILTEFEQLFLSKNLPVHYLEALNLKIA